MFLALTGPDTLAADFPGCPNWKGTVSQLDMVVTLSCEMPDLDQSVEETYDDHYEDYEDYEEDYEGYYSNYVCTGRKKKNLNMW